MRDIERGSLFPGLLYNASIHCGAHAVHHLEKESNANRHLVNVFTNFKTQLSKHAVLMLTPEFNGALCGRVLHLTDLNNLTVGNRVVYSTRHGAL